MIRRRRLCLSPTMIWLLPLQVRVRLLSPCPPHSPRLLPQRHQKVATTTLFFSDRRTSPIPNPMTPAAHRQLPKTGTPTSNSHIILQCPPFLSSTASCQPCDY